MQNELYHHGVKGMRWGVRKTHVETTNYRKTNNKLKKALATDNKKDAKKAFKEYRKERNKPNEKYMTETTKKQRMTDKHLFSYGTVKKINRTLNDNPNMTVSEVRSKVHKEAIRNSNNYSRIKNSDAATIFD